MGPGEGPGLDGLPWRLSVSHDRTVGPEDAANYATLTWDAALQRQGARAAALGVRVGLTAEYDVADVEYDDGSWDAEQVISLRPVARAYASVALPNLPRGGASPARLCARASLAPDLSARAELRVGRPGSRVSFRAGQERALGRNGRRWYTTLQLRSYQEDGSCAAISLTPWEAPGKLPKTATQGLGMKRGGAILHRVEVSDVSVVPGARLHVKGDAIQKLHDWSFNPIRGRATLSFHVDRLRRPGHAPPPRSFRRSAAANDGIQQLPGRREAAQQLPSRKEVARRPSDADASQPSGVAALVRLLGVGTTRAADGVRAETARQSHSGHAPPAAKVGDRSPGDADARSDAAPGRTRSRARTLGRVLRPWRWVGGGSGGAKNPVADVAVDDADEAPRGASHGVRDRVRAERAPVIASDDAAAAQRRRRLRADWGAARAEADAAATRLPDEVEAAYQLPFQREAALRMYGAAGREAEARGAAEKEARIAAAVSERRAREEKANQNAAERSARRAAGATARADRQARVAKEREEREADATRLRAEREAAAAETRRGKVVAADRRATARRAEQEAAAARAAQREAELTQMREAKETAVADARRAKDAALLLREAAREARIAADDAALVMKESNAAAARNKQQSDLAAMRDKRDSEVAARQHARSAAMRERVAARGDSGNDDAWWRRFDLGALGRVEDDAGLPADPDPGAKAANAPNARGGGTSPQAQEAAGLARREARAANALARKAEAKARKLEAVASKAARDADKMADKQRKHAAKEATQEQRRRDREVKRQKKDSDNDAKRLRKEEQLRAKRQRVDEAREAKQLGKAEIKAERQQTNEDREAKLLRKKEAMEAERQQKKAMREVQEYLIPNKQPEAPEPKESQHGRGADHAAQQRQTGEEHEGRGWFGWWGKGADGVALPGIAGLPGETRLRAEDSVGSGSAVQMGHALQMMANDAKASRSKAIGIVAGHWIDPDEDTGALGEAEINMVIADEATRRLHRRGWHVQRPELSDAPVSWEEYLRWVSDCSKASIPVIEVHGQGALEGMSHAATGVLGARTAAPINHALAERFGYLEVDDWQSMAVPAVGGAVLESFDCDQMIKVGARRRRRRCAKIAQKIVEAVEDAHLRPEVGFDDGCSQTGCVISKTYR